MILQKENTKLLLKFTNGKTLNQESSYLLFIRKNGQLGWHRTYFGEKEKIYFNCDIDNYLCLIQTLATVSKEIKIKNQFLFEITL